MAKFAPLILLLASVLVASYAGPIPTEVVSPKGVRNGTIAIPSVRVVPDLVLKGVCTDMKTPPRIINTVKPVSDSGCFGLPLTLFIFMSERWSVLVLNDVLCCRP